MALYKNRKKKVIGRIIASPFFLIIVIILAGLMTKASWNIYKKYAQGGKEVEIARSELNRLSERKQFLAQSVAYLETDIGIEDEIRSKYRVAKPGESVALIVDDRGEKPQATTTATSTGFWNKVLQFVGIR